MTLDESDLEEAVTQGLVSQAQADALLKLANDRRKQRVPQEADEERFRFMRGFNDFFLAIGIILFGSAMTFYLGTGSAAADQNASPVIAGLIWAAGAVVVWGLSELLVRRMRQVLPGILLSCLFMFFIFRAVPVGGFLPAAASTASPEGFRIVSWIAGSTDFLTIALKALLTAAAAGIYYLRFRLPFALLPIAASLVIVVIAASRVAFADAQAHAVVTLACGLAVFGAAMRFDLSDRERITRRSDCAFWLHLLAAPLIVHSLVSMVVPNLLAMNNQAAWIIVGIVGLLTIVALVIDRRALLVSALIYLGSVIAYAITWSSGDRTGVFFATLLILGVTVLALGAGWVPLRRRIMALLSPALATRLPPVVPA